MVPRERMILGLATLVVFGLWVAPAYSVEKTVVFQQGLNGYTGTQDTRINTYNADTNYGDDKYMWLDGQASEPGDMNQILLQLMTLWELDPARFRLELQSKVPF